MSSRTKKGPRALSATLVLLLLACGALLGLQSCGGNGNQNPTNQPTQNPPPPT